MIREVEKKNYALIAATNVAELWLLLFWQKNFGSIFWWIEKNLQKFRVQKYWVLRGEGKTEEDIYSQNKNCHKIFHFRGAKNRFQLSSFRKKKVKEKKGRYMYHLIILILHFLKFEFSINLSSISKFQKDLKKNNHNWDSDNKIQCKNHTQVYGCDVASDIYFMKSKFWQKATTTWFEKKYNFLFSIQKLKKLCCTVFF